MFSFRSFFLWPPINLGYEFLSSSFPLETLSCTEADCEFARPIFLRQNLDADKPFSLVPSHSTSSSTITTGIHLSPQCMFGQGFREQCLHHRQGTALSRNSGSNCAGGGSTTFLKWESATRNMPTSDHKCSNDSFTPSLGSAEPSSLLEWGCGCAFVQSGKSSVVESWKRDKIKPNCVLRWLLQNALSTSSFLLLSVT